MKIETIAAADAGFPEDAVADIFGEVVIRVSGINFEGEERDIVIQCSDNPAAFAEALVSIASYVKRRMADVRVGTVRVAS
jgi:hypothetical protein